MYLVLFMSGDNQRGVMALEVVPGLSGIWILLKFLTISLLSDLFLPILAHYCISGYLFDEHIDTWAYFKMDKDISLLLKLSSQFWP